jgi:hypothetical protein
MTYLIINMGCIDHFYIIAEMVWLEYTSIIKKFQPFNFWVISFVIALIYKSLTFGLGLESIRI